MTYLHTINTSLTERDCIIGLAAGNVVIATPTSNLTPNILRKIDGARY